MARRSRRRWEERSRRGTGGLRWIVGCAAVLLAALAIVAVGRWSAGTAHGASSYLGIPCTAPSPGPAPPPVPLLPGTRAVFFGDSWTVGYGLVRHEDGFAYVTGSTLGLDYQVLGAGGTGYLNPSAKRIGDYESRLARLDPDPGVCLVVLQGGLNDQGHDLRRLPRAVAGALDAARQAYPNAVIVVLGPASPTVPAGDDVGEIDAILTRVAAGQQVRYISPHRERWLTAGNMRRYIDADALDHPSAAGHAYLAERLVEALEARR